MSTVVFAQDRQCQQLCSGQAGGISFASKELFELFSHPLQLSNHCYRFFPFHSQLFHEVSRVVIQQITNRNAFLSHQVFVQGNFPFFQKQQCLLHLFVPPHCALAQFFFFHQLP